MGYRYKEDYCYPSELIEKNIKELRGNHSCGGTEFCSYYHSISFPLISSGIFGRSLDNPAAESTRQCLRAYKKFTADYPEYDIDVKLCAFTASEMKEAENEYEAFKQAN